MGQKRERGSGELADNLLETHLPDQTRDLAEAVGAVLRKCHLVCFGTDVLDPEGQSGSLYQDDPSFVRDLFSLKTRSGGSGYRRTARRAPFIKKLSNAAPQLVSSTSTPGLWKSLASTLWDNSHLQRREREAEVDCALRTGHSLWGKRSRPSGNACSSFARRPWPPQGRTVRGNRF